MGGIIYSSERMRKYSVSFPYYYASFVFAIPPGKPYPALTILLYPYKYIIWSCICVIFLFTLISVVALKLTKDRTRAFFLGPKNNMPVFNMLNITFGGAINYVPTRNFARFILLIWLMMSLVLRTAYQSRLYDYLRTQPHMSPLYYRHTIYSSDFQVYVTETFYQIFYDRMPEIRPRFVKLNII